jgi:hypothetical protein
MAIPSRQIGWSTEENLLWQISKQLEYLTKVIYNIGQTPPDPNCIGFVADTTLFGQLNFGMQVGVSSDVTYTATWGDGTTSNGTIVAGDPVEILHDYASENTAYNVTLCFSDATKVTYLEFYAAD